MKPPSFEYAYQVLVLQAADEGRGPVLFGESLQRARTTPLPFLIGEELPDIYLEFPLCGTPYLDVTLLYGQLEPGTRVKSTIAGEHGAMLDWYAQARREHNEISCGFELDTKEATPPVAAVHFQPRQHAELVRPFCETIGEPERAELYLDLAARMPQDWPLSFFGMFRGRPASPLRVCGYLPDVERDACAANSDHLASAFDTIGFSAYDDAMLSQVAELMAAAPGSVDFQFDIWPDGRLGEMFAIDVQFGIEQPEAVHSTFTSGSGARVMKLLESWETADGRWRLGIDATFARALPVELDDGTTGRYAFTLMPQWFKARWIGGVMQPAKLYHLARAGLIE